MDADGQAASLLAASRALRPWLAERAGEMEAARRPSLEVMQVLRRLGVFRMHTPRRYGGLEMDIPASLAILEELAMADGAVGWLAMHGGHAGLLAARLPVAALDGIYADGPDVVWASSVVRAGFAEIIPGGYRVSGRWPFVSGCEVADRIYGFCVVTRNGKPIARSVDRPPIRAVSLPAAAWTIEDTWRACGLKGTGSHHVSLDNVEVADADTFPIFDGTTATPGPLYESPLRLLPLHFGAVAVGVAQGAVADLADLAGQGQRYQFAEQSLADSPVFHHELGRIEAQVRAARALLEVQADRQWSRAVAGKLETRGTVEMSQCLAWISQACAQAVDRCYALGGASVVYDSSPLQRRLRDIHAVTQHGTLNPRHYAFAGEVLVGREARDPMLG